MIAIIKGSPVKRMIMLAVGLVVSSLLFGAPRANAGSVAFAQVDGGAWTPLVLGTTSVISGVAIKADVTPLQLPSQAILFSTNTTLQTTGTHDVSVVFGNSPFTAPTAPPTINALTAVAPTSLINATGTSSAVKTFVLNGDQTGTAGFTVGVPDIIEAPNQVTPMSQGLGTVPTGTLAFGTIAGPLGSGYTIGQLLQVHLEGSAAANLSITTTLAPEPTSMSLLGIGLVGMVGYGLRRRRQAMAKA